jgi:maltokinase
MTSPAISSLEQLIGSARWFGGKGRTFSVIDVQRLGTLGGSAPSEDEPVVAIELVTLEYDDGSEEYYQVPLAFYTEPQERIEHAAVGSWDDDELGPVLAYDALHDRCATALWLRAFAEPSRHGELVFHRVPGYDLDLEAHSTLFSGEQSNSSVAFGEDSLMKVFRRLTRGRNPDIEIHEALTRAGNEHVAALYGWLEALGDPEAGREPVHLAMLQQFLRTASDGWDIAQASVRDLFAEADLHADEVGGDFAAEAERLGLATAQVHDALKESFATGTWGPDELATLARDMGRRLDEAIEVVPELEEFADAIRATFAGVGELTGPVVVQRVHGDFHLGQTLRTVKGWKIVDFEGEPAKPLSERVRLDSIWRDVAGMLRSFDYAAHAVEADVEVDDEARAQIAYRAAEWAERNQAAFLRGYVETSGRTPAGTLTADQETLLRAYQADKAVYETVYEARNRPTWVGIPLSAIARLAETT